MPYESWRLCDFVHYFDSQSNGLKCFISNEINWNECICFIICDIQTRNVQVWMKLSLKMKHWHTCRQHFLHHKTEMLNLCDRNFILLKSGILPHNGFSIRLHSQDVVPNALPLFKMYILNIIQQNLAHDSGARRLIFHLFNKTIELFRYSRNESILQSS